MRAPHRPARGLRVSVSPALRGLRASHGSPAASAPARRRLPRSSSLPHFLKDNSSIFNRNPPRFFLLVLLLCCCLHLHPVISAPGSPPLRGLVPPPPLHSVISGSLPFPLSPLFTSPFPSSTPHRPPQLSQASLLGVASEASGLVRGEGSSFCI